MSLKFLGFSSKKMSPVVEEKSNVAKVQKNCGAYKFKIEGYSGLSTKVGDSVESPEFTICGHTWQLRIFPGGSLEHHKGFVSYYLASKSTTLARASYKLIVKNQIPGGEDESFSSSGIRVFEPKGIQVDGWGRDKFMLASMLNDPEFGFLVEDAVTFRVELTVFGDLETTHAPLEDSVMPSRNNALDVCLGRMLSGSGSDVTLVVGADSERVPAHKCLLMARSPVFFAMFTYAMTENTSSEVTIPDFEPCVVREMLHFMYTDSCSSAAVHSEFGVALLCLALKYQVTGLVEACEAYFHTQLSEETAVSLLLLADMYHAPSLKLKALAYISQHAAALVSTADYQALDEQLRRETSVAIDAVKKRKGLQSRLLGGGNGGVGVGNGAGGSEKSVRSGAVMRLANSCAIM